MSKRHATGSVGRWLAKVDGETLPCVHSHWMKKLQYDDPFCQPDIGNWPDFLRVIQHVKKVILTKDKVTEKGPGKPPNFERDGYIAIFRIEDVRLEVTEQGRTHLKFRCVERLTDLR